MERKHVEKTYLIKDYYPNIESESKNQKNKIK